MGKAQNRKLQKQYKKELAAAKQQHGNAPSRTDEAATKEQTLAYKVCRLLLLMVLPALFGIFGLVMFPIGGGDSGNNTATATLSESFQARSPSSEGQCVGDNCPPVVPAKDDVLNSAKKVNKRTNTKSEKTSVTNNNKRSDDDSSNHGDDDEDMDIPAVIRDFKATILDHLSVDVKEDGIVVDGRRIKPVELTNEANRKGAATRLYQFDGFLSDRECDGLTRAHHRHVSEVTKHDPLICFDGIETLKKHLRDAGRNTDVSVQDFTEGTTCLNGSFSSQLKSSFQWSHSTSFYRGESKFTETFEDRIERATGLLSSNGKFQVTSYPKGIGYKTHTDCIVDHHDNRDRFATILVYLQDVKEGGETQFPELGISVTPKKGRAIVWNNMNAAGQCDPLSVHTAAQVKEGHKFIIQRWYYYRNFYQLGKRMTEPMLPARLPGQPKVSCDEYEHGSCRWYDEWGYDHMTEYAAQKHRLKN